MADVFTLTSTMDLIEVEIKIVEFPLTPQQSGKCNFYFLIFKSLLNIVDFNSAFFTRQLMLPIVVGARCRVQLTAFNYNVWFSPYVKLNLNFTKTTCSYPTPHLINNLSRLKLLINQVVPVLRYSGLRVSRSTPRLLGPLMTKRRFMHAQTFHSSFQAWTQVLISTVHHSYF